MGISFDVSHEHTTQQLECASDCKLPYRERAVRRVDSLNKRVRKEEVLCRSLEIAAMHSIQSQTYFITPFNFTKESP